MVSVFKTILIDLIYLFSLFHFNEYFFTIFFQQTGHLEMKSQNCSLQLIMMSLNLQRTEELKIHQDQERKVTKLLKAQRFGEWRSSD